MAYEELTATDVVRWLRRKTRTTSTTVANVNPVGLTTDNNPGPWDDVDFVRYFNQALRFAARMLWRDIDSQYRLIERNPIPSSEVTASGIFAITDGAAELHELARVAYVRWATGTSEPAFGDRYLPARSISRIAFTADRGSGRVTEPSESVPYTDTFYTAVIGTAILSGNNKNAGYIRFYNWPSSPPTNFAVGYYTWPAQLDVSLSTPDADHVDLPPMAWDLALNYAWMLACEDADDVRYDKAERAVARERENMLAAMTLEHDLPSGGPERMRAVSEVERGSQ